MDDKVFASATMTAAMTDNPSEYESIPTVNVFDTDEKNLARKEAGGNGTGMLKALPVGAVCCFLLWPDICCWRVARAADTSGQRATAVKKATALAVAPVWCGFPV